MSVRVYTGPHADRRRRAALPRRLSVLLALTTVAAHIAWPLTASAARDLVTVSAVVLFVLTCAAHAVAVRGAGWMLGWLVLSAGVGLGVEALGLGTGLPFGQYAYADRLGPQLFGVPVVVALAWTMMSYPCLLAARRLTRHRGAVAASGALALMAWDLFLDPQMVGEGHWSWQHVPLALPGIPEIPLQNFVGWLAVALVLMALLDRLPRRPDDGAVPPDGVPAALLAWTYVSNVVLALAFAHRPAVAAWGGLVMGIVVVPYLVVALRDRR